MAIPFVETKDCSCYVQCNVFGDSSHIAVECSSHIVVVAEYEGLLWIESDSDDVLRVVPGISRDILNCSLWATEDVLFVICQHDDQWDIEYIL